MLIISRPPYILVYFCSSVSLFNPTPPPPFFLASRRSPPHDATTVIVVASFYRPYLNAANPLGNTPASPCSEPCSSASLILGLGVRSPTCSSPENLEFIKPRGDKLVASGTRRYFSTPSPSSSSLLSAARFSNGAGIPHLVTTGSIVLPVISLRVFIFLLISRQLIQFEARDVY